jgi:DNA-binding PadR family transcriptional regulator
MSLKYGILGLLAERPLHGYEVKNRFESLLGGSWEVNFGQIYTTLQRLERDDLVEAASQKRGDRGKLAYRLTEHGRRALQEWLTTPESGPQQVREDIYVKLLLSTRLANGHLDELLAAQRRVYLQRLKDLSELEEGARRDGRDDLVLLFMGAILHTEADLKWTDAAADEVRQNKHKGKGRQ